MASPGTSSNARYTLNVPCTSFTRPPVVETVSREEIKGSGILRNIQFTVQYYIKIFATMGELHQYECIYFAVSSQ